MASRDEQTDAGRDGGTQTKAAMGRPIPDELLHAQTTWDDRVRDVMTATYGMEND